MNILYKAIFDTGRIITVKAPSKGEAIARICDIFGMRKDLVVERCRIVRLGRIDYEV